MNNSYVYVGIGIAIVITGIFLVFYLESNNASHPNNPIIPHFDPLTLTIVDTRPNVLHDGDQFTIDAFITNLNSFSIPESSLVVVNTFDPNSVYSRLTGCSGFSEDRSLEYGNTSVSFPYQDCDKIFVANSTGEINATVNIQYPVDGKYFNATGSKLFTILPRIPEENGTMIWGVTPFSVNYTITNADVLGIRTPNANTVVIGMNPSGVGVLKIQLPKTNGNSYLQSLNFTSYIIGDKVTSTITSVISADGTLSIPFPHGTTTIQIEWVEDKINHDTQR